MNKKRRRAMLASGKKIFTISYELMNTPAYTFLQINGVGEEIYNSGSFEIEEGDYIYVEAYSASGSRIVLNGNIVAQGNIGAIGNGSAYNFYPTSNATIKYYQISELGGVSIAIVTT